MRIDLFEMPFCRCSRKAFWKYRCESNVILVRVYTCQLFLNPLRENFSDIGRLVSRLPGAREKSLGPSAKGLGRALETQDGRQCLSQKQVWLFIFWTSTDFHTNLTLILDFRHLFNTGNPECFSMREIFVAHAGESIFWLPCGRVPHNAGELACIRVVSGCLFNLISHESVCQFLFYSTVCNIHIFLVSVIDEEDVPGMSVLFWSEIIFAVLCYNVPSVNWSTKLY